MGAVIPAGLRAQVRSLDQERCAYCQSPEELTVTPFEVDHIVPVSAEGETTLDNLCLACPTCNRYKATRQSAPDPETGQDAPLYHPRRPAPQPARPRPLAAALGQDGPLSV